MATIIEMKEGKLEHLSEYAEKILRYGGKLMQCIEELEGKSKYDECRGVDYKRGDYKTREKERWDEDSYRGRYY
jgi:hypothetical protein